MLAYIEKCIFPFTEKIQKRHFQTAQNAPKKTKFCTDKMTYFFVF